MQLFLFDIDGTLIWAHGAGHRSLVRAMMEVFGTAGPHEEYDWRGKTDPLIVSDLLKLAGIADRVIRERLPECFDRYINYLDQTLANGHRVDILPGVVDLVRRLSDRQDLLVGLLTGNVERGAIVKLRSSGLLPCFRLGAYGSDDADRRRLPAIARDRAATLTGRQFPFADLVVIGDTPLDVDCARACGARAVAVATGQHSVEELAATRPDLLFSSFADVEDSLRQLTAPLPRQSEDISRRKHS
jgi:phosphoglycolate phosphatase-like HAD superfamily hydrolase